MTHHDPRGLVYDPAVSLGWEDGPLDGLNCVLRCVEAVLRAQGYDQTELAWALARPLDITGVRTEPYRFRHGSLRWRSAVDGHEHWSELLSLLADRVPVILMPDRYYWPGDEFQGRRHFLDHMVLVLEADDRRLVVLDSDGPPTDRYVRRLAMSSELIKGACRFATIHFDRVRETEATLRATLLEPMLRWLIADLPAVAGFGARWERDGLTGPCGRALHVHVLGEWQPALFTTSIAVAETHPALVAPLVAAARCSQILGKALIGAHRFGGDQPGDVTAYWPVLGRFRATETALQLVVSALAAEIGGPASTVLSGEFDDRLWDRVDRTRAWCYADQVASPDLEESSWK